MAKLKKHNPCFLFYKNKQGKFNYRTIGKNGKSIGGEYHQAFSRLIDMKNNIVANALVYNVKLKFTELTDYEGAVGEFWDALSELSLALYRIEV